MKASVLDGKVHGSYVHKIHDHPVVFVHAGFRPAFLNHLKLTQNMESAEEIVAYVNNALLESVRACGSDNYQCAFDDEVFQAGKDRGGARTSSTHNTPITTSSLDREMTPLPSNLITFAPKSIPQSEAFLCYFAPMCSHTDNAFTIIHTFAHDRYRWTILDRLQHHPRSCPGSELAAYDPK